MRELLYFDCICRKLGVHWNPIFCEEFELIIFYIIGTSCFDISPNTYVNIVSCSPPEPEDGPIEERHNEDKRPDGDVDEKSSRAPERSKELNSSGTQWPKKVGQVVPDDALLFFNILISKSIREAN